MDNLTNISMTETNISNSLTTLELQTEDTYVWVPFLEYEIEMMLWKYIPPFLLVFGILGNILSAIIMSRPSMGQSVTSMLFRLLALVDSLALIGSLTRNYIRFIYFVDLRMISVSLCKFQVFYNYFMTQFSSWVLVLLSGERAFGVMWPHKAKSVITKKRVWFCIFIIIVVTTAMNVHIPIFLTHVTLFNGTYSYCECDHQYQDFCFKVWRWLDIVYYCFLPFSLILFFNCTIVVNLMSAAKSRQQHVSSTSSSKDSGVSGMTGILLTITFSYLILCTPLPIMITFLDNFLYTVTDWHTWAIIDLIYTICSLLASLNNAINFPLYCLSGSKFRHELLVLFRIRKNIAPGRKTPTT